MRRWLIALGLAAAVEGCRAAGPGGESAAYRREGSTLVLLDSTGAATMRLAPLPSR